MKIAVTGASGNLGQRVTRIAIAHGHRVVAVDKVPPATPPQIPEGETSKEEWHRFVEIDVRNYNQLLDAFRGCDAVIHLAAIPNPGDYVVDTHNLNVVSSWNALRAAAELGIERICQASSINAVGLVWGDNPIIDYLPMDEKHPCRPEDPYSLSKLVSEMQADTIVRRWPNIRIASIRLAWAVPNREYAMGRPMDWVRKELWAWVDADESARAFVLGVTSESEDFKGHQPFFIIAPTTCQEELTADLVAEHWPNAELRKEFKGIESLYDCSKAEQLLGWVHASPAEEVVVPQETHVTKTADAEEDVVFADAVSPADDTTSEAHDAVDSVDAPLASSSTELPVPDSTPADAAASSADSVDSAVLEPATDAIDPVVIVSTVAETTSVTETAEPVEEEPSPASTVVEPAPAEAVEPVAVSAAVATLVPTDADSAISAPAEESVSPAEPADVAPVVEAAPTEPPQEVINAADPAEVPVESDDSEVTEHAQPQFEQESSSSSESSSSDSTSAEGDIDGESALSTDPSEVDVEQQIEVKLIVAIQDAATQFVECAATEDVPGEHLAPPALPVVEPIAP